MSELISRQDAIDAIEKLDIPEDMCVFEILSHIELAIGTLPSAERKRGKWIRITQGAMPEKYMCPFCHRTVEAYGVEELLPIRYPYCHCGADMRGDTDE